MKNFLFDSFRQWKVCFLAAVKSFLWGLMKIVYDIIFGIVSVFVWLWRCAVSCVGRYPHIALGGFVVLLLLLWLVMYARGKAIETGLTAQKDKIAWQYQDFKEKHGYE